MSKVRVYGFEGCPYCDELKSLYDENNIKYDYIDIEQKEYQLEFEKICELSKSESVPIILDTLLYLLN